MRSAKNCPNRLRCSCRLDEPVLEGLGDSLRFGVDLELFLDAAQVEGDGVDRDAKLGGGGELFKAAFS